MQLNNQKTPSNPVKNGIVIICIKFQGIMLSEISQRWMLHGITYFLETITSVMRKTRIPTLGQEDPMEKGTATHSSILAWRIPWTEEPGELQSLGFQTVGHD